MVDHPAEHELELIFLAPGNIDGDLRNEIEHHLLSCDPCREFAELLKSFHAAFDQSHQSTPNVEAFIDRLLISPKIVELRSYRFTPDASEFGEHTMTVLAAKSEAAKEYRYSTVCTLMSRNEESLVRILKDRETDKYKIYLITKKRQDAKAMVRFPALQLEVHLNPETHQAEFSLPAHQPGIDWTNIIAELRFS